MPPKPTIRTLARRRDAIQACFTVDDICRLLGIRAERLLILAENPQYREFQIPKKNGKMRHIEDPIPALKRVQDYLADFLQAVYYFHRTDAAYGFVIRPVDDPEPRHVLSNARRHLGKPWLMNLDMQDFFHTATRRYSFTSCHHTAVTRQGPGRFYGLGRHTGTPVLAGRVCCAASRVAVCPSFAPPG